MAEDPELDHEVAPAGAPALGGLRRRGIYLLPNLFTTGVLFCGFFAIVQAMNGRFEVAAVAVYVAMVLDGMDGRVARWTNTQSEFGAQYDSIADMVAFGAGIRLARFNANIAVVDKRYFQGLPSPSGAAVMTGLVWVLTDFGLRPPGDYSWLIALTWVVAVFTGMTMVSNVPFWSFKEVNWKKRVPLWVILVCVIAISVVASSPSLVLFALFMSYALSGYVMWAMGHRVRPVLPEE